MLSSDSVWCSFWFNLEASEVGAGKEVVYVKEDRVTSYN